MKILNGRYYAEGKDKRYISHPTQDIILRLREEQNSLRTQFQVQNELEIRRNQKVIKKTMNIS